jgi:competence protein ComEA
MSRMKPVLGIALALGLLTAQLAFAQGGATTTTDTKTTTQAAAPAKAAPAKRMAKVDINTASEADLAKLPGIGDATADKIIAARPFKSKNELLSKGIVTKAVYSKISSKIVAKQAMSATK